MINENEATCCTHRQELQRPDVVPLRLQEFIQNADSEPLLFLQVLPALRPVLTSAFFRHVNTRLRVLKESRGASNFLQSDHQSCVEVLSGHSGMVRMTGAAVCWRTLENPGEPWNNPGGTLENPGGPWRTLEGAWRRREKLNENSSSV